MRPASVLAITIGLLTGFTPLPAATISVFTTFDVAGAATEEATGVNDSGQIVGYYTDSAAVRHGFTDFNGVISTFDIPGASGTELTGINNAGVISGWDIAGGTVNAFTDAGGIVTNIVVPGAIAAQALAISNNGQLAGVYAPAVNTLAGYTDDAGAFASFSQAGVAMALQMAINDSGELVEDYLSTQGQTQSFLFTGGQLSAFLIPGSGATGALAINDSGVIAGGYALNGFHGFLDLNGSVTTLDVLGSQGSLLTGYSDSGNAVGAYVDASGATHLFATNVSPVPEAAPRDAVIFGLAALFVLAWRRKTGPHFS